MAKAMDKDAMKRCVRAVSLLADLSEAQLDMVVEGARPLVFKKGARIFEEGSDGDCCFVLTSGKARVVLAGGGGAEILLQILMAPALVGELALLDRSTRSASLIAADACHLIRIPGPAFEALRKDPAFEQRLVARLISILRASDDRVRVISSFPSPHRVAWCLGRIARHSGRREDSVIVIAKPPHNELAEMAGCTRETVSRTLHQLRRKRYLNWDDHVMRLDIALLQRFLTTELTVPEPSGSPVRPPTARVS